MQSGSVRPGVSSGVQMGKEAHVVIGRIPFPKDFQVPAGYCLEVTFSFLPLRPLPQGNFLIKASSRRPASRLAVTTKVMSPLYCFSVLAGSQLLRGRGL